MTNTFKELGLKDELIQGLEKQNIIEPTQIQKEAITRILENKDIIGRSATGTGKTLAYLLPLFQKIDTSKKEMQVLILTPTHELAMQVFDQVKTLAENSGLPITSAAVIGNVNINRQIKQLRDKQHIIVGSSVRVLQLIRQRKITAHTLKTIVIDEFDTMLHKSNRQEVEAIIKTTLRDRQLLYFSASDNYDTVELARKLSKDLEVLRLKEENPLSDSIEHIYFKSPLREKMDLLRRVIHAANPEKALVFINRSYDVEKTVDRLKHHKISAEGIHGSDDKLKRQRNLEGFRDGSIKVLVASDVMARGLDVQGISHIINLDMPETSKEYLHRVGRTGRAGEKGVAISIITNRSDEQDLMRASKDLKVPITEKDLFEGKIIKKENKRGK